MNNFAIELSNIGYTLPDQRNLFSHLNFKFEKGNIYVIQGESGQGKTTLLSIINNDIEPSEGKVVYSNISNVKELISFTLTDHMSFLELTGKENLDLVSSDEEKKKELTSYFGIGKLLNKKAQTYSKGELARLSIVRTLLQNKPIMLFDEPTGNLDKKNSEKFYTYLKRIAPDHIVICVSHNYFASEINLLQLNNGKLNLIEENRQKSGNNSIKLTKPKITIKTEMKFLLTFIKSTRFRLVFLILLSLIEGLFSSVTFSMKYPKLVLNGEVYIDQSATDALYIMYWIVQGLATFVLLAYIFLLYLNLSSIERKFRYQANLLRSIGFKKTITATLYTIYVLIFALIPYLIGSLIPLNLMDKINLEVNIYFNAELNFFVKYEFNYIHFLILIVTASIFIYLKCSLKKGANDTLKEDRT